MQAICETTRLVLRPFAESDAESLFELNNDLDVMKFTGDNAFSNMAEAASFIKNYSAYNLHGMGRWTVLLKDSNTYCGWCGLKWHPDEKLADLGFRLLKSHWNKGIATEAAKACLDYGFSNLQLSLIIGRCRKENLASIRVLEKLGMKRTKEFSYLGGTSYRYEMDFKLYDQLTDK